LAPAVKAGQVAKTVVAVMVVVVNSVEEPAAAVVKAEVVGYKEETELLVAAVMEGAVTAEV
jgi:hypothetical protein